MTLQRYVIAWRLWRHERYTLQRALGTARYLTTDRFTYTGHHYLLTDVRPPQREQPERQGATP